MFSIEINISCINTRRRTYQSIFLSSKEEINSNDRTLIFNKLLTSEIDLNLLYHSYYSNVINLQFDSNLGLFADIFWLGGLCVDSIWWTQYHTIKSFFGCTCVKISTSFHLWNLCGWMSMGTLNLGKIHVNGFGDNFNYLLDRLYCISVVSEQRLECGQEQLI